MHIEETSGVANKKQKQTKAKQPTNQPTNHQKTQLTYTSVILEIKPK